MRELPPFSNKKSIFTKYSVNNLPNRKPNVQNAVVSHFQILNQNHFYSVNIHSNQKYIDPNTIVPHFETLYLTLPSESETNSASGD